MRVVMLSKALVVGAYQKKAEELARLPGVELTVLVPPYWHEGGRRLMLERAYSAGYDLRVTHMALNGHFHLHFYLGLHTLLQRLKPDVVHVDEEPYNFATAHAIWTASRLGARTLFFTWQNILRRLPPPFSLVEMYSLRKAGYALAGNQEASAVLRRKGYRGRIAVIPQFGIDPKLYQPSIVKRETFTVGYLGRLVPQKGLLCLFEAVAGLGADSRLILVGDGPYKSQLTRQAEAGGLAGRVAFLGAVPSVEVPRLLSEMDVLVLPSLTCSNWKEQFGRALVEAMACEVAVVGSDSGEIPNVIGEAGLVFPEGQAGALRDCLARLQADPEQLRHLGQLGRQRVLDYYTQASVARRTYDVYAELLANVDSSGSAPSGAPTQRRGG